MNVNDVSLKAKYARNQTFFQVAQEKFLTVRGKSVSVRNIGKNTRFGYTADGDIVLQLWESPVVTLLKGGGMKIDSCGYKTATTKARIQAMLPSGVGLYSEQGIWYVNTFRPSENRYTNSRKVYQFVDGMLVSERGKVLGAPTWCKKTERAKLKLKKRVRKFVVEYMDALFAGEVPAPSGGDCWICLLKDKSGKPLFGRDSADKGHVLGHMDEPYYVPSMLANAIDEAGGLERLGIPARVCLSKLWAENERADVHSARFGRERLSKVLLAYLYRRLGFAAGHLPGHLNAAAH